MAKFFQTMIAVATLYCAQVAVGEESLPPTTPATLSDEYLERWTPGGDTNSPDLPYPHNIAAYQSHKDPDWRDERWQLTEKGPFLSHSILLGDQLGWRQVDCGCGRTGQVPAVRFGRRIVRRRRHCRRVAHRPGAVWLTESAPLVW